MKLFSYSTSLSRARFSKALLAIAVVTSIGGLSACGSTGEDNSQAAKSAVTQKVGDLPAQWSSIQERLGTVEAGWLAQIDDDLLNKLVNEALANNFNLQAAAASVSASRALADQAASALSPQLGVNVGGSDGGQLEGRSRSGFNAALQASWELDLWGKIEAGTLAAQESLAAAEAEYIFSQYSLAAGVARAYFVAIEAQQQLAIAQQTYDAIEKTASIVKLQFDNGVATQQDVSLANAELATADDALISARGAQRDATRALELLLGRYPSAELAVAQQLPSVPEAAPVGLPSELLERRPDLIAAERKVAAAFNSVDQAKAAKLPSVSLSSNIGGTSSDLSRLLNPVNVAWQALGSIAAPLIDGGRLDAAVEAATAEQTAAIAGYAQAALQAFADVETALDQGSILRQRQGALRLSLSEAENALRIANLQFEEGEIALLDVLQIQQRVFGARRNVLSIDRAMLSQFVDLNLALGGSWQ
jgi:NodT family efflux transporter outer membrane factor (OMF) lipoprotein